MLSALLLSPSFGFLVIPIVYSGLALLIAGLVLLMQREVLRKASSRLASSRRRGSPRVASLSNLAGLPNIWLTTERNNCESKSSSHFSYYTPYILIYSSRWRSQLYDARCYRYRQRRKDYGSFKS